MTRHAFILNCVAALACCVMVLAAWGAYSEQELEEAEQYYQTQGPEAALPVFEGLVEAYRSADSPAALGRAMSQLGGIHWRLGNYGIAEEILLQALALQRDSGDRVQQGKSLNRLGLLHWDLGDFEQAKAYFAEGSKIAEDEGDRRLAGAILNNLSLVSDELGDYYVSLEQYRRVLALYEGLDFPRGTGDTLGNIGGVYLLLGRYQEALGHYQQALAISERLASPAAMSQDHGNLALSYLGLGQVDAALVHFDRAIDLAAGAGMRQDEAYWLGSKGNAMMLKGRYDLGLELHRAGLDIYRQVDSKTERVEALHDMGNLHLLLGDSAAAAAYFQQAVELAREIGQPRGITMNLVALGDLLERRGDYEAAAAHYAEAAARAKEAGAMGRWAIGLTRLASAYRAMGRYVEASAEAAKALEIARETGAAALESEALFGLAETDRLAGRPTDAVPNYRLVIDRLLRIPDTELAWRALYGNGLALADQGKVAAAIASLQKAVGVIEGVREHLRQERFRAGYVQDKYQVYVDLVRLQLVAGRQEEAFSTAERLRSRSYLDLLGDRWLPDSLGEDQVLEFALRERILTLRRALTEEQGRDRPEQRQAAIDVYSQELLAAEQAYQAFLDNRPRTASRNVSGVPTYADVRGRLAADEALVEYVVGTDSVVLFLLTTETLSTRTSTLRRADLDNKVDLLRNLIRLPDDSRWEKPAASLARALLQPLFMDDSLDGVRHLYLVPHGTLNYLPFALLPVTAGRSLVEDYTLAYLPTAAALLQPIRASGQHAPMLALAPTRSQLQYAPGEARAINALFGPGARALIGASATESTFKSEAAHYRMLHLATHGYFNKLNPLLSGLELEADEIDDGRLELHEVLGMQLDADLVTLSACQTGLGSGHFAEIPAGDDFVGLTRAFLYAGSSSVLATLWEVDDASTADLMTTFYKSLNGMRGDADRALALANSQREMLASKRYRHPFYWAPFVLVGSNNLAGYAKS